MADFSFTAPSRFGKTIVLLVCFILLVIPLFNLRPVVFYSGVMPFEFWIPKTTNQVGILLSMLVIFGIYIAIGVVGWIKNSWLIVLSVPGLAILISLVALLRFGAGMSSF
jgi:ABC-type sulfate transport system permease subunit